MYQRWRCPGHQADVLVALEFRSLRLRPRLALAFNCADGRSLPKLERTITYLLRKGSPFPSGRKQSNAAALCLEIDEEKHLKNAVAIAEDEGRAGVSWPSRLDAGSTPTYQVREGKEIDRSQIRRFGRGAARADSRRVLDPSHRGAGRECAVVPRLARHAHRSEDQGRL